MQEKKREIITERVQAEQGSGRKGKGVACVRCTRTGTECVPGEGKAMACVGCQQVRQWCEKPGEEGTEKKVVQQRKRVEEVPKGSQRKKARMESEPGGSGRRTEEQEEWMLRQELHDFGKQFLVQWDQQNRHMEQHNKLLGQLVELKAKEVWGTGLEENDNDINAEMEREELERLTAEEQIAEVGGVAAIVASLMAEAKKAKRMEGLEVGSGSESESESSEDSKEELAEGMDEGV